MAWLNATPEGDKQSRREQYSGGGEGSPFLVMPPVDDAEYILALWHEAGTIESGSGGISRLSWDEINAWLEVRDKKKHPKLKDWEIDMVRMLSENYASEYNLASEKSRQAPCTLEDEEQIDRDAIANKVTNLLGAFKKANKEPRYEVVEKE